MSHSNKNKKSKRDNFLPKGRQVKKSDIIELRQFLKNFSFRPDMLIEALHIVQDNKGFISLGHIAAIAELFKLSQVEVYEVASFYHHFKIIKNEETETHKVTLRICEGLTCEMKGAHELFSEIKNKNFKDVYIQKVPCIGRCNKAPAVNLGKRSIDNASINEIEKSIEGPFTPIIPNYENLEKYIKNDGYFILKKLIKGKILKEEISEIINNSGLKGLGGAGFPSGKKWEIVNSFVGPRLMTVNGDEGEPGTFKDRYYLEKFPHRILEGALIAAFVVECKKIYIYMRDEYPAAIEILKKEVCKLKKEGFLLTPIEIRRGAGAYICGEESAMIESIEGKRGIPRHKPPYIAEIGLFGMPTLNHNIETLYWIPEIIEKGPDWFSSKGWSKNRRGLRSFSVSGRVKKPGVKIAPAGIPLNKLIDNYCGGMEDGHTLKAFFPGGASGGVFPAHMANKAMDFGSWEEEGGFIGSHGVVIMSQKDSVLKAVINTMKFFKHESCGQCTPCRNGTEKMTNLLLSHEIDFSIYKDLLTVMSESSICGLGQAAGNCVKHLIKHFPEEIINA